MPELVIALPFAAEAAVDVAAASAFDEAGFIAADFAAPSLFASLGSLSPTLVSLAASTALSYGISFLTKPNDLPGAAQQVTVRQALPSRFVLFGRSKTAGVLFFNDVEPSVTGKLTVGKILACHPINLIEQHFLNEYQVGMTSPSGGPITGPPTGRGAWANYISFDLHLGAVNQAASGFLIGLFGAQNVWTTAHRLQGLAYAVGSYQTANVKNGTFYSVYPTGAPEYRAVLQGRLVYDPRDFAQSITNEATWKYSDNAALVLAFYIMHPDGWGLGAGVIDPVNLIQEANVCDQIVPTPDGTGEKRYRCWGRYDLSEQRKTVLAELLQNCLGRVQMQASGKIKITVGRSIAPSITLDEDSIIACENFIDGPDPTQRVGTINPRIVHEPANWQTFDCPPVKAMVYNSDDRFGSNILDMPLRFCPSPYQAQRIAKKILDEKNSGWRGTLRCNLAGLKAFGEWLVTVNVPELGIVGGLFEVLNLSLDRSNMTIVIGVREMTPAVFDWTALSSPLITVSVPGAQNTFAVPAPVSVSAGYFGVDAGYGIRISWTNPTTVGSAAVASNQVQYRPAAAPGPNGWIETDPPVGTTSWVTPQLTTGSFYDIQVRSVGQSGNVSDWVTVYNLKNGP